MDSKLTRKCECDEPTLVEVSDIVVGSGSEAKKFSVKTCTKCGLSKATTKTVKISETENGQQ